MLFPYLLKVSFLLAVLTLTYRWLIQYETFSKINRLLLLLNIVAAWSLPLLPLGGWGPLDVQSEFHQSIPFVAKVIPAVLTKNTPQIPTAFQPQVGKNNPTWTFLDVINLVYLFGVIFMSVRLLAQLRGLLFILWKIPSENIGNRLKLIRESNSTSPYSFFYWIICDPEKHPTEQLRHILAHEAEHAIQWHSLDLLLAEIQKIALWINPFAWYHQKLVQENLEYLADQAVLKKGFERKQYQFSLLNVALMTKELPLTNSFAQSLLKKRIKMMNRKPSKAWVLGKYAVVILLIYVSSAFVAPYRERIVNIAPTATRHVVEALLPEAPAPTRPFTKFEKAPTTMTEQPSADKILSIQMPEISPADSIRVKAKGILIQNDTLYWAVSALTTWDDINLMRKEIKDFGAEFDVTSFKYDPLNLFLTSVSVRTKARGSSGEGSSSDVQKEGEFTPIKGCYGFLMKSGLGMGQVPPTLLFNSIKTDYEAALALIKQNEVAILEKAITSKIGQSGSSGYPKRSFEGKDADNLFTRINFGKSTQNTLRIGEQLKNAAFYINGKPVTIDVVTSFDFDKFAGVKIVNNFKGAYHVLIPAQ